MEFIGNKEFFWMMADRRQPTAAEARQKVLYHVILSIKSFYRPDRWAAKSTLIGTNPVAAHLSGLPLSGGDLFLIILIIISRVERLTWR
jgi:hypothetical protein